jgi:hypothetical protein
MADRELAEQAGRHLEAIRGRHRTAVELARRHGMGYEAAYKFLKDAAEHPFDPDRQLALRRAVS